MNVAVILVNYNSNEDTIECVRSLSNSTIKPFIIIVDNNSINKNIHEQINFYDHVKVIYNNANLGFGRANNVGITWTLANTKTEYLFILNNDTIVEINTLETLIKPFFIDSKIGISTCKIVFANDSKMIWYGGGQIDLKRGKPKITDFKKQSTQEGAEKSRYVDFASGCAMMFKRDILKKIKGFDERMFMYVEDLELCMRLKKNDYKIWYTADTKILHKVHASIGGLNNNLPALHPKNPHLNFYVYHMTKNLLLTMNKHLTKLEWSRFLLNYSIFMGYKNFLYFINERYKANRAFFKAVLDFYNKK